MPHVFISYARSTAKEAQAVAAALRGLGHEVWLDDEIPAHRAYADVIEERLRAAKAVVVIWSVEAVKSQWVQSEADRAREDGKLVQLNLDGAKLPMPFDRIQCADMGGWTGDLDSPGWCAVVASVTDLMGARAASGLRAADPPLPNKPSIAVLSFANLSGDPEQDYFADGMVEEIGTALSRIRSIFVIASGSGLSFKGTTPQEAGRTLGVRYVLEGSVRKSGGRVRIAVKLIDTADGGQLWADRFEDTLEDVFALQDRVALSVAGVIEPAVREADLRRASGRPTENMGSYDLCLRAQSLYRTHAKADMLAAIDLLNTAIGIDPDYGLAMALAVVAHANVIVHGWSDNPERHIRDGRALIQRAIKAAGDDPDVLINLAFGTLMMGGDLEAAATFADRAMALNPGSSMVWLAGGIVQLHSGEPRLAFEHFETSLRLDPLSHYRHLLLGMMGVARIAEGRFAEAIHLLKQSAQLAPGWPFPYPAQAAAYGHLGETNAAANALARFRELTAVDIRGWAARWANPDLRKLLLEGIAVGEAESPADTSTGS